MSTRTHVPPRTVDLSTHAGHRVLPRVALVVVLLLLVAVAGLLASQRRDAEPATPPAGYSAPNGATSSGLMVTGTGPGLAAVAGSAEAAELPAVTGTGPGLVEIAGPAHGSTPKVTGTGPGLERIASAGD